MSLKTQQIVLTVVALLPCGFTFAAPAYIGNLDRMPDWQQPTDPAVSVWGYPNWCSPTAVANVFGWWEDAKGAASLTDGWLSPLTRENPPGAPLQAGLWKEKLWQDGTIELGWYMNTGGWQSNNPQVPGLTGTTFANVSSGAVAYAKTAWEDGVVVKTAFPNTTSATYAVGAEGQTASAIWDDYKNAIDSGLPVIVSWSDWVNTGTGQSWDSEQVPDGEDYEEYSDIWTYDWLGGGAIGHTTTGVGYIDVTGEMGDEWLIVHDNWSATQTKVAVPLWDTYIDDDIYITNWIQNDHFFVPEPASVLLLLLGGIFLRKRTPSVY